MATYDNIFKHIAGEFAQDIAVLSLETSEVEVIGKLNTEHISVKTLHSDIVYCVQLPNEKAILHIEAQTDDSRKRPMYLRMLAYSSVLALEHQMNVYSTVLYLRPPAGKNDPGCYKYGNEEQGGEFRYKVVRVYELEGKKFLDPHAIGVLPFTGLMKPPQVFHVKTGLRSVLRGSRHLMLMTRCGERFCLHSRFSQVLSTLLNYLNTLHWRLSCKNHLITTM